MQDFLPDFSAFNTGDFQKLMEQNKIQTIDWGGIMDMNRKNAEMLATIQQINLEAWQDVISTTQKIAQDFANEQAKIASNAVAEGSPEDKIAQSAKSISETYDKAHKSYRQIADIQYKLSQNMSELISRRIKANLKDLQEKAGK